MSSTNTTNTNFLKAIQEDKQLTSKLMRKLAYTSSEYVYNPQATLDQKIERQKADLLANEELMNKKLQLASLDPRNPGTVLPRTLAFTNEELGIKPTPIKDFLTSDPVKRTGFTAAGAGAGALIGNLIAGDSNSYLYPILGALLGGGLGYYMGAPKQQDSEHNNLPASAYFNS